MRSCALSPLKSPVPTECPDRASFPVPEIVISAVERSKSPASMGPNTTYDIPDSPTPGAPIIRSLEASPLTSAMATP